MRFHDAWGMLAVGFAAFLCGIASFSGLWWSVRRTLTRRDHGGLIAAGSAARFAMLAAVFWIATRGEGPRLAAAVAGFAAAQALAIGFGAAGAKRFRRTRKGEA